MSWLCYRPHYVRLSFSFQMFPLYKMVLPATSSAGAITDGPLVFPEALFFMFLWGNLSRFFMYRLGSHVGIANEAEVLEGQGL